MATINVSDKTKTRFKNIKISESAKRKKSISEDELQNILMDKFERGKK